jgi:hypothetical protein
MVSRQDSTGAMHAGRYGLVRSNDRLRLGKLGLVHRGLLMIAVLVAILIPRLAAAQCGDCDPGTYWSGVSDGAYRFDSSVSANVQQAVFWAQGAWGSHYHDQNNSNAILIMVGSLPPGVNGSYNNVTNVLTIAQSVVDMCPTGCNYMESVINHELGHSLGFDDIQGGCEDSIMSWDRNRHVVTGPSSEDFCWWENGGGGGGGEEIECPDPPCQTDRLRLDSMTGRGCAQLFAYAQLHWFSGDVRGWPDLVALVRLKRNADTGRSLSADVLRVIGGAMIFDVIPSEIPIVENGSAPRDDMLVVAMKWDPQQGAFLLGHEIPTTILFVHLLRMMAGK